MDLVKPTGSLQIMRVSCFSAEHRNEETVFQSPFVPRYRLADFDVASWTDKKKKSKRVFSKSRSAFAGWVEDNE